MLTTVIVVIIAAVIVGAAMLAGLLMVQRRRRLQRRFGPEYDRLVEQRGSRLRAEAELMHRERRVRQLDIRPLTDEERAQYSVQWAGLQEEFVDRPADAVSASQVLVTAVMKDRGYPMGDREQVLADLSVDHSSTLEHYRAAEQISEHGAARGASTEDLRHGMIHYRALFMELLGEPPKMFDPPAASGPGSDATADERLVECPDDLVAHEKPDEPAETADKTPEEADAAEAADADIPMPRMPRS